MPWWQWRGLGAGGCGDDEIQACDEDKTRRHQPTAATSSGQRQPTAAAQTRPLLPSEATRTKATQFFQFFSRLPPVNPRPMMPDQPVTAARWAIVGPPAQPHTRCYWCRLSDCQTVNCHPSRLSVCTACAPSAHRLL
ncbi:hypothetical protein AOQ84DRAFT_369850 [Glonium stellatum]|uniref:Uncharacterized protein n=1 Tax=Glonium stellatum TaxID=574774 RepID=A0A8E2JLP6_9PEZI|nr:hypothetical protein AOQ84DRAFT_369850 [Glonium stellatum]